MAKPNGFTAYCKDKMARDRRAGINRDLPYYTQACGEEFAALPQHIKQQWKERAQGRRSRVSVETGFTSALTANRAPSTGGSVAGSSETGDTVSTYRNSRADGLRFLMKALDKTSPEDLIAKPVYFTSSNVMCVTGDDPPIYYPMEIGIVKYSLLEGIADPVKDKFHRNIDPGELKCGYASRAKEHVEKTHKMPIWPCLPDSVGSKSRKESVEEQYSQLLHQILAFISDPESYMMDNNGERTLVLFAPEEMVPQMKGILRFLTERCDASDSDLLGLEETIVFLDPAVLLMMYLRKANRNVPYPFCVAQLRKCQYDYTMGKNCTLHEEMDNMYCALGSAVKMCYLVSDAAAAAYDIKLTNKHLPEVEVSKDDFEQDDSTKPPSMGSRRSGPSSIASSSRSGVRSSQFSNRSGVLSSSMSSGVTASTLVQDSTNGSSGGLSTPNGEGGVNSNPPMPGGPVPRAMGIGRGRKIN